MRWWIPELPLTSSTKMGMGERESCHFPALARSTGEPLNATRLQIGGYIRQWSAGWVVLGHTRGPWVGQAAALPSPPVVSVPG